jgi:predicted N-acetyltransferase YhbS
VSTHSLIVRPFNSTAEYSVYYRLATTAFSSNPSEEEAQRWQHEAPQRPGFHAERVRGAFRDDQVLGGYTVSDRALRMGAARLSIGAIGAVVTAPEARKQGVARALMQDALTFARDNNHALLLLDGIPNFYFRYGYTDMFDVTALDIDRSAILAQPPTHYQIRPATVDDASAILALYERHFGDYTGSFGRSLELQVYDLLRQQKPRMVALSPQGNIEGYLLHGVDDEMAQGQEVAADNWDTLLALLHYHARLFSEDSAPTTLLYFLPLDAPMTHWIIDTLTVPDTLQWHSPAQEWGVRSLAYHHHFTGWMGCLTNFPLLMASIVPELQARWQRSLAQWSGEIVFTVAGQTRVLHIDGAHIQLREKAATNSYQLELSPQALVQLVFGYRPLSQLTTTEHLSDQARWALAILFPTGHTWIPRSDWF